MPAPVKGKPCPCGRERRSKGQRDCRDCHNADMRQRRRLARERGTYTLRGAAPALVFHVEHPSGSLDQRRRANCRSHTHTLIARGTLVPQPCEDCGATKYIEAHHEDYSKPREVRWKCIDCHRRHHAQERERAAVSA